MMRTRWLPLLLVVAFAGTAGAQQVDNKSSGKQQPSAKSTPSKPKASTTAPGTTSFGANQITGKITQLNRSTRELTIDRSGKPESVKLSDNATVFTNGRLGSFEDLREGQQVRAAYEERGGQKSVRWIEVTPKDTDAAPKTTPPAGGGADVERGAPKTKEQSAPKNQ